MPPEKTSEIAPESNLLDYLDESFYLDFRAQGHGVMIQYVWIYEHDVDFDGLRRFYRNLGHSLLSRCVEDSPMPMGRARWVQWHPPADFDVAAQARPFDDIPAWVDEQAALPIDIENGPPWRLAILPIVGGGAAVTLIVGHAVGDGVGALNAIVDAVNGVQVDPGYPPPHTRRKFQALGADARQLIRDLPQIVRAIASAPRAAKELPLRVRPGTKSRALVRQDGTDPNQLVRLPALTVFIDPESWDQQAAALGGNSIALFIGITARLCGRLNWVDNDGLANVAIPVNERKPGDTRGNALTAVLMTVDPAHALDLPMIRAEVKVALAGAEDTRKLVTAPLPLMPLVPTFVANRLQRVLLRSANITCSHIGMLDPTANRPDGTDAEWFYAKHARDDEMLTRGFLRRAGGIFFPVGQGRVGGRVFLTIAYSDADATTTPEGLTELVTGVLDEFGITPTTVMR
jgi:diacylglycerol O-acyltransferase